MSAAEQALIKAAHSHYHCEAVKEAARTLRDENLGNAYAENAWKFAVGREYEAWRELKRCIKEVGRGA